MIFGEPGYECAACGRQSEDAAGSRCCPVLPDNTEHIWTARGLPDSGARTEFTTGAVRDADQSAKADAGKPRIDLIPATAELLVGEVLRFGAEKYAEDSWKGVPNAQRRYLAAARRHINAHQRGERTDAESGLPHLAHAACNIMFVLELCEAGNP